MNLTEIIWDQFLESGSKDQLITQDKPELGFRFEYNHNIFYISLTQKENHKKKLWNVIQLAAKISFQNMTKIYGNGGRYSDLINYFLNLNTNKDKVGNIRNMKKGIIEWNTSSIDGNDFSIKDYLKNQGINNVYQRTFVEKL